MLCFQFPTLVWLFPLYGATIPSRLLASKQTPSLKNSSSPRVVTKQYLTSSNTSTLYSCFKTSKRFSELSFPLATERLSTLTYCSIKNSAVDPYSLTASTAKDPAYNTLILLNLMKLFLILIHYNALLLPFELLILLGRQRELRDELLSRCLTTSYG